MLELIKHTRHEKGLSQQQLASFSGISLASLQAIESGKSNPSLFLLEKILKTLGLDLKLSTKSADWELLCFWGVPLTSEKVKRTSNRDEFFNELIQACLEIQGQDIHVEGVLRKKEAVQAMLLALQTHWPHYYKLLSKAPVIKAMTPKEVSGRHIKLRRVCLARLGELFWDYQ